MSTLKRRSVENSAPWGTVAVLVSKSHPKSSANGNTFVIFQLSNLAVDEVTLFLYGQACLEWRKEEPGAVLGASCCHLRSRLIALTYLLRPVLGTSVCVCALVCAHQLL